MNLRAALCVGHGCVGLYNNCSGIHQSLARSKNGLSIAHANMAQDTSCERALLQLNVRDQEVYAHYYALVPKHSNILISVLLMIY